MHTLAAIGGVVALASHFFWMRGVWKGTLHLNLATWLLWALFDTAIAVSSLLAGAPAPFMAIGFSIGAIAVAGTLLLKGEWRWGRFETACTLVAVVCFLIWYTAGPLLALVSFTVGKYAAGALPTVRLAFKRPEPQQSWIWFLGTFSAATNIYVGGVWTVAQSLFPTVAFFSSTLIGLFHLRGRLAACGGLR